jgi:prepilin-type N-terminal cleavage/methylation domain-containing protein
VKKKRRHRLCDKAKAFTLIELLVVVAIISLLVSILLPSLQKAKDLARQTVCMTTLKGYHLGLFQYVQDNNEYLLVGLRVYNAEISDQALWTYNPDFCATLGVEPWADHSSGNPGNWTKGKYAVLTCPADQFEVYDSTIGQPVGTFFGCSYGYNEVLGYDKFRRITEFAGYEDRTCSFTETVNVPWAKPWYMPGNPVAPETAVRHLDGQNFLLLDGLRRKRCGMGRNRPLVRPVLLGKFLKEDAISSFMMQHAQFRPKLFTQPFRSVRIVRPARNEM